MRVWAVVSCARSESAHAFRQVERVKELARVLLNLPIKEYQVIGQYYLVWCRCRQLEYQSRLLERIVEETNAYKAKALLSRGTFELYQGNPETALHFYEEGLKTSPTISEYIGLSIAIAAAKGEEGFHKSAIADMEKIVPLIGYAEPRLYYDFLNSYAVELTATNHLEQAEALSARAVSSPFGPFYREWQETYSEVRSKRKRRSIVTISQPEIEQESRIESDVPTNPLQEARVDTAIDFMRANLHRKITLPQLSELVNLSPSHFSHLFKIQTSVSPIEYLIRLRIEKARDLLATTFLSIKQIMASVGYSDKQTFLQQFRRRFDLTPSAYRKRALSRSRRY